MAAEIFELKNADIAQENIHAIQDYKMLGGITVATELLNLKRVHYKN